MTLRVYVPRDTTALALGADLGAQEILRASARRGQAIDLVRNGSRGLFWLEPLVEVELDGERIAFGPVSAADVPALLVALADTPAGHPLYLGTTSRSWPVGPSPCNSSRRRSSMRLQPRA